MGQNREGVAVTPDPLIHVRHGDEKWNICLSTFGKWLAGIAATLFTSAVIGALGFAMSSKADLSELMTEMRAINKRLDVMDKKIDVSVAGNAKRIERLEERQFR